VSDDAFAPENFGRVVLIQLMRLYDVQLALLSCMDPEKAKDIVLMHEQGITFMPNPAFAAEEDEDGLEEREHKE
jgi:hypothetical protein